MTTELAPLKHFQLTANGIEVTGRPTFADWQASWQWLKRIDHAAPWIIGDMLVYGEDAFGEQISQELDENENGDDNSRFSPGSLRQYRYVSRQWPPLSRLNAPWSYHQVTAHLPMNQRISLLQHCAEHGIKRAELRCMVRQLNNGQNPNPPTRPDDTIEELHRENYELQRRVTELESVAGPLLPPPAELTPTETISRLAQPLAAWMKQAGGYSSVTVYRDGRIVIEPLTDGGFSGNMGE